MQLLSKFKTLYTNTFASHIIMKECANFAYLNKKQIIDNYTFFMDKYVLSLEYLKNEFKVNTLVDGVTIDEELKYIKNIYDKDLKGFRKFKGILRFKKERMISQNVLMLHRLQFWINPSHNKEQVKYLKFFYDVTKKKKYNEIDIDEITKKIEDNKNLIYDTSFIIEDGNN